MRRVFVCPRLLRDASAPAVVRAPVCPASTENEGGVNVPSASILALAPVTVSIPSPAPAYAPVVALNTAIALMSA